MKIIFKIHFLFFITAFVCIFTGLFKDFIVIMTLILIHELGHITAGILFKWPIEKVIIYPFGGLTIFNQKINSSLLEEFIIAIFGSLFQIGFFIILMRNNLLFRNYHYALLIFNLIPIVPLDGSKILGILLNKIFPFKYSLMIILILSFINIFFLLFLTINYELNLILILILILLFSKVIKEYKNIKYIFNKFLFERYLYKIKYKKIKKINGLKLDCMSKSKTHYFINKKSIINEEEILSKMFDIE